MRPLTQDEIYQWDGEHSSVKNRPIMINNPDPGCGWGCIPQTNLIEMLRRMAMEQGKQVTIAETTGKPRWAKVLTGWLVFLIGVGSVVGVLVNWVKP